MLWTAQHCLIFLTGFSRPTQLEYHIFQQTQYHPISSLWISPQCPVLPLLTPLLPQSPLSPIQTPASDFPPAPQTSLSPSFTPSHACGHHGLPFAPLLTPVSPQQPHTLAHRLSSAPGHRPDSVYTSAPLQSQHWSPPSPLSSPAPARLPLLTGSFAGLPELPPSPRGDLLLLWMLLEGGSRVRVHDDQGHQRQQRGAMPRKRNQPEDQTLPAAPHSRAGPGPAPALPWPRPQARPRPSPSSGPPPTGSTPPPSPPPLPQDRKARRLYPHRPAGKGPPPQPTRFL